MPTPDYQITCTKNLLIAKGIYDVRFTKPEGFSFEAGQFVLFDVPLLDDSNDIQTRAYSIASTPHENELIFVIKLIEGGRASKWVEESLSEGTNVRMQGPLGRFLVESGDDDDLLFLCTSTGIAPFRSQILTEIQSESGRKMELFFGNRHEEDIFWKEEFEALAKEHDFFTFHPVLSKPSDKWEGHCGHVQDVVAPSKDALHDKHIYICGNPAMADELKKLSLEEWNVVNERLHVEGFI